MARKGKEPVYLAVAPKGIGVVETFLGLLKLSWDNLNKGHDLDKKLGFAKDGFVQLVANQLGTQQPITKLITQQLAVAPK
jgi:hypothetical protein